jgi:hypothetical protein
MAAAGSGLPVAACSSLGPVLSYQELARAQSDAAIELVRSGMPAEISGELDDEHPVIPLAADVCDDVAMTAVLSWTDQDHGREPGLWLFEFRRRDGDWERGGGQSSVLAAYPLAGRLPAPPGSPLMFLLAGPNPVPGRAPGERPWRSAALYVTAAVARVRVGRREVPVPFHGYLPVAMASPRGNPVTALGSDGITLETLDLRRGATALYREQRQRSPGGWPHRARRL